jgi:hypothetical protein
LYQTRTRGHPLPSLHGGVMGIYEKLKLAWVCGYRQVDLHIES